jgi:hypothetical protein
MENIPNGEQNNQTVPERKTAFYNESGQIADSKSAMGVAYVEKEQGRDAALRREEALRFEAENGLSEEEAKSLEKAKVFATAFPFAFEEGVDEKGFPAYVMDRRKVGAYNYGTIAKYVGNEKRARVAQNTDLIRNAVRDFDIGDREPQERELPIFTHFESFAKFNRRLTFSREGIKISIAWGNEKLNSAQRSVIPFDRLSEDTIELLCTFLNKMNENGEITREVDENIRRSQEVDTLKGIIENSAKKKN